MDFKEVEKKIEDLNKIKPHSTSDNRDRYYRLYNSIYEDLLLMEKEGTVVFEKKGKTLSYLRELLMNDGPEFSYTFEFWSRDDASKKYRIGVCIRGLPICKPI
ncbi:MAG: hypothetical protein K6G47_13520 [Clostridia bacterium]|nr:hypothetical protein [Clostridia bacterium]